MKKPITIALLILASIPFLIAVAQLPQVGSTENPTYTHVASRYLESGPEEAGCENIVTAVILNYRGYDTDGEVTVIFTALVAVLGVLLLPRTDRVPRPPARIPPSPVTRFIVHTLAPFIVMFSIYMILYGHETPGGGFQGGTIIGALVIVLSLVSGSEWTQKFFPEGARLWSQPAAVLMFGLVGVAGMIFVGPYLAFPHEGSLLFLRTPWLTLLEVGIGIGGAAIVASIFWAMEGEG